MQLAWLVGKNTKKDFRAASVQLKLLFPRLENKVFKVMLRCDFFFIANLT